MGDPVSCGNFSHLCIEEMDVFWRVNFEEKKLKGRVRLLVRMIDNHVDQLVLQKRGWENDDKGVIVES